MDLELYDCTLREGEQSAGASFSLEDRVDLFRRLNYFPLQLEDARGQKEVSSCSFFSPDSAQESS